MIWRWISEKWSSLGLIWNQTIEEVANSQTKEIDIKNLLMMNIMMNKWKSSSKKMNWVKTKSMRMKISLTQMIMFMKMSKIL